MSRMDTGEGEYVVSEIGRLSNKYGEEFTWGIVPKNNGFVKGLVVFSYELTERKRMPQSGIQKLISIFVNGT